MLNDAVVWNPQPIETFTDSQIWKCKFFKIKNIICLTFQVVKNRFSGDLGTMPLFFNRGTLTFSKKIYQKERSSASQLKRVKKDVDVSTNETPKNEFVIDEEHDQMS